jgi:hypothetical protein
VLTREQILARKTGKGTATLPDGSTVAIRAMTRDEVIEMQAMQNVADKDNFIIATGMTDPKLTVDDVAAWAQTGDAGDLVAVSEAVATLSGLRQGADKSGVRDVRGTP